MEKTGMAKRWEEKLQRQASVAEEGRRTGGAEEAGRVGEKRKQPPKGKDPFGRRPTRPAERGAK